MYRNEMLIRLKNIKKRYTEKMKTFLDTIKIEIWLEKLLECDRLLIIDVVN